MLNLGQMGNGPIRVSQPRMDRLPMEKDCNFFVLHCPFLQVLQYTSFVLALAPNLNSTVPRPCWITACPTNCKPFCKCLLESPLYSIINLWLHNIFYNIFSYFATMSTIIWSYDFYLVKTPSQIV
jgi:hypothetical protein